MRISILFQLIPDKLSEEILRQTTKWESYSALKDHLQTLHHLRTTSAAPVLYNVEEHSDESTIIEEEVVTEDGKVLRLERRDGKPVAERTRPGV